MNNKTAVIVSDTTTESFDGVLTTDGILTTEYDATKSNTVYINSVLSLNYTVTTPLFYTTDILPATEVETPMLQSSFISADTSTSMLPLNIAEGSRASTDIISIETVVTVRNTTAVSFVTTADILSTSFDFTLELSRTFQSTNVPVMTSIETNDIHLDTNSYMWSSALFYLSTDIPGMSSESDYAINVKSQIQSAFSSPELISSSLQDLQSVSSSIGTYLTTPHGNYKQVTTPIQRAFSENFIIISASVAGVIIIMFGSSMVLYWLNKLPGQQRHKSNELHRDKSDNISWSSLSPNNYMHNESYSGPVYQYRNIPLRLISRFNFPCAYDHHINYQNDWSDI